MKWKWRLSFHRPTETEVTGNGTRMSLETKGENTSAKVKCQPVPSGFGGASGRALSRFTKLVPPDSTARAFAQWLAEIGADGTWLQDDLYGWYCEACHFAGLVPMPRNSFGFAMRGVGCNRYRADMRKCGVGKRVWVLNVPRSLPVEVPRVPRVPKAPKSMPPWPELKLGPEAKNGAYRSVSKVGGASAIVVGAR